MKVPSVFSSKICFCFWRGVLLVVKIWMKTTWKMVFFLCLAHKLLRNLFLAKLACNLPVFEWLPKWSPFITIIKFTTTELKGMLKKKYEKMHLSKNIFLLLLFFPYTDKMNCRFSGDERFLNFFLKIEKEQTSQWQTNRKIWKIFLDHIKLWILVDFLFFENTWLIDFMNETLQEKGRFQK